MMSASNIPKYLLVIIIIDSLEFFTSVLADGLSLEIEWQQVSYYFYPFD